MFVALRDLRFARGRFLLIGAVVALITVLVGFLSGLTGGLAAQNVSAVLAIPADRIVLTAPEQGSAASFADSSIGARAVTAWRSAPGVTAVQPIGISQTRAEHRGTRAAIAVFGVEPGFDATAPATDGTVTLSKPAAAALGATTGDTVSIAGSDYRVGAVAGDGWYSHTPVVQTTLRDWQRSARATGEPGADATALAVSGDGDWSGVAARTDTVAFTPLASLAAIGAFRSEIGSLAMMVALLFGISALVIGAFFTVWTMQRSGDIAVLKALGASTRSLVRDALGQALIVLVVSIGVGIGLVAALGAAAGTTLPFLLSPLTTVVPGAAMTVLGLVGAAFALRSVTAADPLTALGSNR